MACVIGTQSKLREVAYTCKQYIHTSMLTLSENTLRNIGVERIYVLETMNLHDIRVIFRS